MNSEKEHRFYDKIYESRRRYSVHYSQSPYQRLYKRTMEVIKDNYPTSTSIIELGCGTGQFAEYLNDEGYKNYRGLDFSEQAIKKADKRIKSAFIKKDVYTLREKDYKNTDLIIAMEVMEHIKDKKVLKHVPKNMSLIITLPDFPAKAHLRYFKNKQQIRDYYEKELNIESLVKIPYKKKGINHFVIKATKK